MLVTNRSAGIIVFRRAAASVELIHPGGPFWAKMDAGSWSIPKGFKTGRTLVTFSEEGSFQSGLSLARSDSTAER
jgi:predicted NUDIX family NTP pyrophosphohydrolase